MRLEIDVKLIIEEEDEMLRMWQDLKSIGKSGDLAVFYDKLGKALSIKQMEVQE
jgi:hypothetical protein